MKRRFFASCCVVIFLCSCNNKPSDKDIASRVLDEYVCRETAKVITLNIIDSKETKTFLGGPAYQVIVSGEVSWPTGCREFGTNIPSGYSEKFTEKSITLVKDEEGDWH